MKLKQFSFGGDFGTCIRDILIKCDFSYCLPYTGMLKMTSSNWICMGTPYFPVIFMKGNNFVTS